MKSEIGALIVILGLCCTPANAQDCNHYTVVIAGNLSQATPAVDVSSSAAQDHFRAALPARRLGISDMTLSVGLFRIAKYKWAVELQENGASNLTLPSDYQRIPLYLDFGSDGLLQAPQDVIVYPATSISPGESIRITFQKMTLTSAPTDLTMSVQGARKAPCVHQGQVMSIKSARDAARDELNPITANPDRAYLE